jgi:arylsulfatase A-like enzyme
MISGSPAAVASFMPDNGGVRYEGRDERLIADNSPLRAGKGHLYEGGIREPMFIRWPGVVKPGSIFRDHGEQHRFLSHYSGTRRAI